MCARAVNRKTTTKTSTETATTTETTCMLPSTVDDIVTALKFVKLYRRDNRDCDWTLLDYEINRSTCDCSLLAKHTARCRQEIHNDRKLPHTKSISHAHEFDERLWKYYRMDIMCIHMEWILCTRKIPFSIEIIFQIYQAFVNFDNIMRSLADTNIMSNAIGRANHMFVSFASQ